jgi:membrane protease YdiL (CAAX protease family)
LDFPPLEGSPPRLPPRQSRIDPASAKLYAMCEILLCSGVPSQFALTFLIAKLGFSPYDGGHLSFGYVTTLLMLDALLMIALIFWFLHNHGERAREVFLGPRPTRHEVWLGIPMTGVVFMLALLVLSTAQKILPSLHNVPDNPLQQLIATRSQAIVFAIVATIAGGLREEIQRAFIIHRFGQHLGGEMVGLFAYSVVFGLGHALQGWDAVVTTTFLGLFWGYVYISRRSIVAPVVSHSGFNAAEIFQYFMLAK